MAVPTLSELEQMLSQETGVKADDITLDTRLDDMGMDSMDQAKFAAALQHRYGVQLNLDDLGHMTTVGDFYQHIVSRTA